MRSMLLERRARSDARGAAAASPTIRCDALLRRAASRPRRAPGTRCRAAIRCERGSPGRSRCCAAGTVAGRPIREPTTLAIFWARGALDAAPSAGAPRARQYVGGDARAAATATRARARSTRAVDRLRARLRQLAGALGRGQPLPAQRRRRSSRPSTTPGPSIPVAFRLGALGLARLVRRARLSRHAALVRHQRQQLRRGRRVRPARARLGGHRRRRERRSRPRPISTTRPSATPPAICARSISTATTSRAMSSGPTAPGRARAPLANPPPAR